MDNPFNIGPPSFNFGPQPSKKNLAQQYTVAEVAQALSVSPSVVRKWIQNGTLKAYKYGPRLIRIDEKDVLAIREQISGGGQK